MPSPPISGAITRLYCRNQRGQRRINFRTPPCTKILFSPSSRIAAHAVSTLQELFQRSAVWRIGDRPPPRTDGLATGFTPLDRELPDGGWLRGALTELLCDHTGIGELASRTNGFDEVAL